MGSTVRSLLTRVKTEMSFSFSISGTSQKEDSLSSGGELSQLVEGVAGSLGSSDSVSGSLGEFKSDDSESFRYIEKSGIIGDGSNNCYYAFELIGLMLRISVFGEMFGDSGE